VVFFTGHRFSELSFHQVIGIK